jgi:hypothetical protein
MPIIWNRRPCARAVNALAKGLDREGTPLSLRLATLRALTAAGKSVAAAGAAKHLKFDAEPETVGERSALLWAVGELRLADQRDAVAAVLKGQPIDVDGLEADATRALARLDPDRTLELLTARLRKKYAAGLIVAEEIRLLGEMPAATCVPALLEAFKLDLTEQERQQFALVCMRRPNERLVPALTSLLDPRHPELRAHAIEALRKIDTPAAARAVQPHLKEETDLYRKLRIAEFLGRHGIRDGCPYAMEHLSGIPRGRRSRLSWRSATRAPEVLREILKTSNDTSWNSVAVRALGALGGAWARSSWRWRERLQAAAGMPALAAGRPGRDEALTARQEGLLSRRTRSCWRAASGRS